MYPHTEFDQPKPYVHEKNLSIDGQTDILTNGHFNKWTFMWLQEQKSGTLMSLEHSGKSVLLDRIKPIQIHPKCP